MARFKGSLIGLLLGLLIPLPGCARHVRPDPIEISATAANYPTAEFSACGGRWLGLGTCLIREGDLLDAVSLTIQGYYKGTIRIVTTCVDQPLPDSVRYSENRSVRYSLPGKASQSCAISFVVSPEYPDEGDTPEVIHSFFGHLYIRVIPKATPPEDPFHTAVLKLPAGSGTSQAVHVPVGTFTGPTDVSLRSEQCSVKYDKTLASQEGFVSIPISEVIPELNVTTCVISGVIFAPGPIRVTWLLSGYDSRFQPLPVPDVKEKDGHIFIDGGPAVSIIALDDAYAVSNTWSFKADLTKFHLARLLTVKGRSALGERSADGKWRWIL